jgi:hypothetical protein
MSKKFDVVIGNPPYQAEAQGGGTRDTPVYHLFMDAAYEVGKKVVLITPARFLFNGGFTPKAWNIKMLADPHLTVPHYESNSDELFPGTDIKGGIAVTYRDEDLDGDPVETFTRYPELNGILHKVVDSKGKSIAPEITSSRSFRYTEGLYAALPALRSLRPKGNEFLISTNTFAQFGEVLFAQRPDAEGEYSRILGLAGRDRAYRWIRTEYLTGPASLEAYKVALPKANGSGTLGEVLSTPLVIDPQVAVTQTFITVGCFDDKAAADACLKYVKSKFARALLGVLKSTQDNPAKVWKYVPLQDYTASSDVDWSKPIPQIDQQLYAKYGLDAEEIAFIEAKVKPME